MLSNGSILVDLDSIGFYNAEGNDSKKIVLELNEGFMCKETIESLVNLKIKENEDSGFKLASAFVEAGLKVPKEVFVGFFGKLYK